MKYFICNWQFIKFLVEKELHAQELHIQNMLRSFPTTELSIKTSMSFDNHSVQEWTSDLKVRVISVKTPHNTG